VLKVVGGQGTQQAESVQVEGGVARTQWKSMLFSLRREGRDEKCSDRSSGKIAVAI